MINISIRVVTSSINQSGDYSIIMRLVGVCLVNYVGEWNTSRSDLVICMHVSLFSQDLEINGALENV